MNNSKIIQVGRPTHYLVNKQTACGLVGTFSSTNNKKEVNCLSCRRTLKFKQSESDERI
jgi:hypothetical protein